MMTSLTASKQAAYAYDVLAPYYDDFTAGYAYERWMEAIEARALALGLSGRRALDLACGTGKSTAQLIARGYSVLACDISPGMIAQARRRYPENADRFTVADMRCATFSVTTRRRRSARRWPPPASSAWWPGSTRVRDSRRGSTMSATSSSCTSLGTLACRPGEEVIGVSTVGPSARFDVQPEQTIVE